MLVLEREGLLRAVWRLERQVSSGSYAEEEGLTLGPIDRTVPVICASDKGRAVKTWHYLSLGDNNGTVTRRTVEESWLIASNTKENHVGSELKFKGDR